MSVDTELDVWRRQWQAEAAVPADLRAKVQRESRRLRILFAVEVLITIGIGGWTTAWAVLYPATDVTWLAIATWTFLASAWTFAAVVRRGCWAPSALNTAAFLDVSVRRARSTLAATRFGIVLYLVEMMFCLAWVYQHNARQTHLTPRSFLASDTVMLAGFATTAFAGFVICYRRKKKAELVYLLKIQHSLTR